MCKNLVVLTCRMTISTVPTEKGALIIYNIYIYGTYIYNCVNLTVRICCANLTASMCVSQKTVVNDTHLMQRLDSSISDTVPFGYRCIRILAGNAHNTKCAKRAALVYSFSRQFCRMHLCR